MYYYYYYYYINTAQGSVTFSKNRRWRRSASAFQGRDCLKKSTQYCNFYFCFPSAVLILDHQSELRVNLPALCAKVTAPKPDDWLFNPRSRVCDAFSSRHCGGIFRIV